MSLRRLSQLFKLKFPVVKREESERRVCSLSFTVYATLLQRFVSRAVLETEQFRAIIIWEIHLPLRSRIAL